VAEKVGAGPDGDPSQRRPAPTDFAHGYLAAGAALDPVSGEDQCARANSSPEGAAEAVAVFEGHLTGRVAGGEQDCQGEFASEDAIHALVRLTLELAVELDGYPLIRLVDRIDDELDGSGRGIA
jgi:hypothetical protein